MWLGPAPWAPFTPSRIQSHDWYFISDYCLGYIAGWGVHHADSAQQGSGLDHVAGVIEALRENNANAGGGYLVHYDEQRIVRGEGLLTNISDIENVVLRTTDAGTPVFVRDIANVALAPMIRQGAVTRDEDGECVIGVVMLLAGENGRVVHIAWPMQREDGELPGMQGQLLEYR